MRDDLVRGRLQALTAQHGLPASAAGRLGVLLERLAADERSLTTVRDADAAVDVHVADSLVALDLAPVREADSLADLGAGAGIPSLVLAAARSDTRVVAIESVRKKADFIATTAQAMGLANVEVQPIRAEEWTVGMGTVDVVTARALAPLAVLVEYAAPLLDCGGALVAWKGKRDPDEEAAAAAAAAVVGLREGDIVPVTPFAASRDRHLHLYFKVAQTPDRFPRRPGMARKRPLAG